MPWQLSRPDAAVVLARTPRIRPGAVGSGTSGALTLLPVADLWATHLVAGLPSACCRRTPDNRLGLYSDCRLGLYSDGPPTRTILVTKLRAGLTASSGSWRARHPSRAASTFPRRSASSPRSTAGADALRRPDRLGGDSDVGTRTGSDGAPEHEVQHLRAPVHDALIARCSMPGLDGPTCWCTGRASTRRGGARQPDRLRSRLHRLEATGR